MPFYTAEVGRQQLQNLQKDIAKSKGFELNPEQSLTFTFEAIGLLPPSSEDLNEFKEACPIFNLKTSQDRIFPGATQFDLTVFSKREKNDLGEYSDLSPDAAVIYCLSKAIQFMCAFSISTGTVSLWRFFSPAAIKVVPSGKGMPQTVVFQETYKTISSSVQMHAGQLYGAIEIFLHLHSRAWSERFFELYQTGMTLFATPELPGLNFREEAYNSFYKCLEYLVMKKVLRQRGDYKSQYLVEAFRQLGISSVNKTDQSDAAAKTAVNLSRRRGNLVSHYVSDQSDEISVKEVYELKCLVDFMIRCLVQKKL